MQPDDLKRLAEQFELASRRYAERHAIVRDPDWFLLKMQEELGELTQAWLRHTGRGRRPAAEEPPSEAQLADEAADLLGHVLLLTEQLALDLPAAIQRKWRFDPAQ